MSVSDQEVVSLGDVSGEERGRTPSQKRAAEESPTTLDEASKTHIRREIKRRNGKRSVSLANSEDRYTGSPTKQMLEGNFETPKHTCKARSQESLLSEIQLSNKYDKLNALDKDESAFKKPDTPRQRPERKAPKNKPIEVYLNPTHRDPNLSKGIRDLEKDLRSTGNGFVPSITRINQKTYKVHPRDDTHKAQILHVLNAHGYKFSSPQERKDAPHKVVIRGLDLDKPLEDIKAEIAATMKIDVLRVAQFTDWSKKARPENNNNAARPKLPLFVVSVPNTEQGKKIHALQQVGCLNVKVKPFRPRKSTLQCHNCQRFGHIKYACHDDPVCFRCAGPHPSGECDAAVGAESKCANCKGPHPSTLRECPSRKDYEQKGR